MYPPELLNEINDLFRSFIPVLKKLKKLNRTFKTFAISPSFINRRKVFEQIVTGYLVVDTLLPLGKGQRALIAGDRQTGKSSIAIDTIINQVDNIFLGKTPLFCIYVAIGQKCSSIAYLLATFRKYSCYYYTSIVAASSNTSAGLQYLAPYTGCALGESYMNTGRHSLLIYDDLSKHSLAYRQISLLLRKMPGREAYPTDIF
jgi:proton translocating ATP synthase F1 alpha subunit